MPVSREHRRVGAYFGLMIGGLSLGLGLLLRVFPGSPAQGQGLESQGLGLGKEFAFFGLLVAGAATAAAWLAWPRRHAFLQVGLLPIGAMLGLSMSTLSLFERTVRDEFLSAGLETCGAFTMIVSLIRWVWGGVAGALGQEIRDMEHRKLKVRRASEKKKLTLPVHALALGDEYELSPGEDVPVDSVIVRGAGFVDETPLVGAALPVPKKVDDYVFAGSTANIPELLLRVEKPFSQSFIAKRERMTQTVGEEVLKPTRLALFLGITSSMLCVAVCIVLLVLVLPDLSKLEVWLPMIAALFLVSSPGAASLRLGRLWLELVLLTRRQGLIFSRAKDVVAFTQVKRWRIDPLLLAAPGPVEAVALAHISPSEILQIATALLADAPGPELDSLRASLREKNLEPLHGAALRKGQAVHHGTVQGDRWYLGPAGALEAEEKITLEPLMEAPVEFLRSKGLVTWLLAKGNEGVVGALGIGAEARPDAKKAALALRASLLPGLPDTTRRTIAGAAGIESDGPPLGRQDGSILSFSSPPPSAGLRVRVLPFEKNIEFQEHAAPKLLEPALARFGELALRSRRWGQKALLSVVALAAAPSLIAFLLAAFGVLNVPMATLLAAAALFVSTRLNASTEPMTAENAE